MKLIELIEKEELLLDCERLAEWKGCSNKLELFNKIDEIRDRFVNDIISTYDWGTASLIYKLVEEIKDII